MKNRKLLNIKKGENSLDINSRELSQYSFKQIFDADENQMSIEAEELNSTEFFSSYTISKELITAVNAAIITGRPLLLQGEPGCGKTKLAKAVAVDLHKDKANQYYFEWHIKSKSEAKEGTYVFDHVRRLRDATLETPGSDINKTENYVELRQMARAFLSSPKNHAPSVLLIDEIDKGDIDFPNDLLLELDELRFKIPELKDLTIEAHPENKPLVIITSNNEKELPPAFLRRCLYYYIEPFGPALLKKIVLSKLKEFSKLFEEPNRTLTPEHVQTIVEQFLKLKERSSASKSPSTSELLDWVKYLQFQLAQADSDSLKVEDLIKNETIQKLTLKLTV